jgi:hypothetical protein
LTTREATVVRERWERARRFTVLDGVALVMGAAVASVHLRDLVNQDRHLTGLGWALVWITFSGVALSAAGPFLFLARRFGRRPDGYPREGDWLWFLLGVPWALTALLRPRPSGGVLPDPRAGPDVRLELYSASLWIGLGVASLVALAVVWKEWVMTPPKPPDARPPTHWTDRVGLGLAIAWPLQWGFGLVVLG